MSTSTTTLHPAVPIRVKPLNCTIPVPHVTDGEFSKSLKFMGPGKRLEPILLKAIQTDCFSRPSREGYIESIQLTDNGDSSIKRVGKFLLGPKQGSSPLKCIQQYLARKDGTDEFYILKILTMKDVGEEETTDDIQGKVFLHAEYSLLSLMNNQEGVVHEHGMFMATVREKVHNENGEMTIKDVRLLCLVLDCHVAHDFSPRYSNITNMQCYVIMGNKLPESEAIRIFFKVVQIVDRLHRLNIIHRDLKLGNIVLNMDNREVTLTNFCLGKHLSSENDLLKAQRGSPAYVSPDVISGKPYLGKPSDMWALGIVLYTMLFGQFPFYDQSPTELFRKIKLGDFQIPTDVNVSQKTVELIQSLLVLDPKKRLTASQALEKVRSVISAEQSLMSDSDLQIVPDCHPGAKMRKERSYSESASNCFHYFFSLFCKNNYTGVDPVSTNDRTEHVS